MNIIGESFPPEFPEFSRLLFRAILFELRDFPVFFPQVYMIREI